MQKAGLMHVFLLIYFFTVLFLAMIVSFHFFTDACKYISFLFMTYLKAMNSRGHCYIN